MSISLAPHHKYHREILCGLLFFFFSFLHAQSSQSLLDQPGGYQWKEPATIVQIIQQEKAETTNSLSMPDLSDWSRALLEAYSSYLTHTLDEIPGQHDMSEVLNTSFHFIRHEQVADPKVRAMVMDEMKVKQNELIQKLTNQ
jgi:hypothetical protein